MLSKYFNILLILAFAGAFILNSCSGAGDARKRPPNVKDRIQKNIDEGRGIKLMGNKKNVGEFDFASSNELWRASLDTLDFMPLALANYSGGVIVTDWYSDNNENNESVKISIRFLSNEVRADALNIKVFYKNCSMQNNCKISDKSENLSGELARKILSKAAIYEKETQNKKKRKYNAVNYKD